MDDLGRVSWVCWETDNAGIGNEDWILLDRVWISACNARYILTWLEDFWRMMHRGFCFGYRFFCVLDD